MISQVISVHMKQTFTINYKLFENKKFCSVFFKYSSAILRFDEFECLNFFLKLMDYLN